MINELGIYDMTIEVSEDAPKSLQRRLNQNICNGGGGGGQTSTSGIDPEFKPDVQKALGISRTLLEEQQADPTKVVAGLSPQQIAAINAQSTLANQALSGTGIYDTKLAEQRELKNLMGSALGQASYGGSLGSARSQKAMQSGLLDRAGEYAKQRQAQAEAGAERLGEAGTSLQKQRQAELAAKDTSLDRFFNRLTGVASKSTTTSGGK